MKSKNTFWLMLALLVIIFTSCSESSITELKETAIDFSEIGYQLDWDYFLKGHDYHLEFSYRDNTGWSAHLLGHKWETEPTATLKINNQKIDIEWRSPFSRDPILPPWHQGYISIDDLNLQSGEEITIEIKSSKGVSKTRFRLPSEKPQIVDTPPFYRPDEDLHFNWELYQIADFQAVSVNIPDECGNLFSGYFKSLPNSTRNHTILANTLIEEEYFEYVNSMNIGVYNVSVKSAGNQAHVITAMKADEKRLQIDTD